MAQGHKCVIIKATGCEFDRPTLETLFEILINIKNCLCTDLYFILVFENTKVSSSFQKLFKYTKEKEKQIQVIQAH